MQDEELIVWDNLVETLSPQEVWNSNLAKKNIFHANVDFVKSLASWVIKFDLTFKYPTTRRNAQQEFKLWIRALNEDVFGNNFTSKVKHSYFSYYWVIEDQKRDVPHFHGLIDRPINLSLARKYWRRYAGFCTIEKIKWLDRAVGYICKELPDEENCDFYIAKKKYTPAIYPPWWPE